MILIETAGGFGNQLQQYAFCKKLESLGADVRLDLHWFSGEVQEKTEYKRSLSISRLSGISFSEASAADRERLLGKEGLSRSLRKAAGKLLPFARREFTESGIYHGELMERIRQHPDTDLYIRGFFACEAYYADLLPSLRDKVSFPVDTDPLLSFEERGAIHALSEKIRETEAVSIHIRRGDYLDEKNRALFGGICTADYYLGALSHVLKSAFSPRLFVFSDDPSFSEAFVRDLVAKLQKSDDPVIKAAADALLIEAVNVCHGENSLYDVYLMSLCRHNITANSTFSFWGARFNAHEDKIMVRPERHKNSQPFDPEVMKKLWPGWTFVSEHGNIS
ncbi:MAG: alpha-1,2-fucosyltransferase [Lachnospiraceae bacterium]|nr:alpha-1,2-fucosyltransferase [Lachnospiraceae bacterium]